MIGRRLRLWSSATTFVALSALSVPLYILVRPFGRRGRNLVQTLWAGGICRLLNLRITVSGRPFNACATLYCPNHVSYLDIVILGGIIDAIFIAKSEVARWPGFGFLAKLSGTMFIRRYWREALVQRDRLAAGLQAGNNYVLFAEGTSSNGLDVLPFKTSLLSVAEPWVMDRPVAVQPVAIIYRRLRDGRSFDETTCDLYAWYGCMPFLPHLRNVMSLKGCEIEVVFGEPRMSWSVQSRKVLGPALQREIRMRVRGRDAVDEVPASEAQPVVALAGQYNEEEPLAPAL